jgi:hypothetical protein
MEIVEIGDLAAYINPPSDCFGLYICIGKNSNGEP